MTGLDLAGLLFCISNLAIFSGYLFLALFVAPRVTVRLRRTRWGAIGFLVLCGLHHLDNVFFYLFQGSLTVTEVFPELHMLLIDVPQAICVWLLVTGLYFEFVHWGPWHVEPWDGRIERRHGDRRDL